MSGSDASAAWPLQKAVFAALAADAALSGLVGDRIYDDVPQSTAFPYLAFAQVQARDWSTGTETGEEHVLLLHVWSRAAGRGEAHAVVAAIRDVLHDAALTLDGHRLVQLRHEQSDVRRDPAGETVQGIVRLRALTEPLA
ncbi:MAG: DUF3168 domain-containing protein [Hyphomicrobiaceae bacterium]